MATIKNILVLTDFSQNATSAQEYALQLAIKIHANLILYNAYRVPPAMPISGNIVWPHDAPISLELQSISNLESRVSELKDQLNLIKSDIYKPTIRHLGDAGTLANNLNDVVSKNNIWLVIMGTKGEGFANTLIFGSNVFKVLNNIKHPVLIIPQNADFTNLRKIAYATDLRSTDLNIIKWLKELSEILKIELFIMHVSPDTISTEEAASKNITEQILYKTPHHQTHIKYLQGKNIKDSLHEILDEFNVDIIALMHRQSGFFDSLFRASTSYKMVKHTKIPVLIFPESE